MSAGVAKKKIKIKRKFFKKLPFVFLFHPILTITRYTKR